MPLYCVRRWFVLLPLAEAVWSVRWQEAFAEHLEKYVAHVKTRAEVKKEENAKAAAQAEEEAEYVPLEKGEQARSRPNRLYRHRACQATHDS